MLDIISRTIREKYSINGSLSRLPGENPNLLVQTPHGVKYVAKIIDDTVPEPVVQMQMAALKHASKRMLSIRFPRIVENYNKQIKTRINTHNKICNRLIIMDYIEGQCLQDLSDISDDLRVSTGVTVAAFSKAMQTFDHPAAHRTHHWDLTRVDCHREVLGLLQDRQQRSLLEWAFDRWADGAAPFLHRLPWQFIHARRPACDISPPIPVGNQR